MLSGTHHLPSPHHLQSSALCAPEAPNPARLQGVAYKTVAHIKRLGELGAYNTNHFFRVDAGFVAQTADVLSGRETPLSAMQRVGWGRGVGAA